MERLKELVSLGITTKNRWQDLYMTLSSVSEFGLNDIPIIIYDDNSEQPCPYEIATLGLINYSLKRSEESKGLIVRRNQLANMMDTKYYLSLDDDSYPVNGSINNAIEFAESRPDLFCLSFPIFNPIVNEYQNPSHSNQPYKVRFFVGCGHLLHIERFKQLGGYREELVHQGEEMEIAARAFQQGWYCYHFPNFQIHHNASLAGRNWHRMDFYGSRNIVLWNDWFVPKQNKLYKQGRTLLSRILLLMRVYRLATLKGEFAGLFDIPRFKKYRQEMSWQDYKTWLELPAS